MCVCVHEAPEKTFVPQAVATLAPYWLPGNPKSTGPHLGQAPGRVDPRNRDIRVGPGPNPSMYTPYPPSVWGTAGTKTDSGLSLTPSLVPRLQNPVKGSVHLADETIFGFMYLFILR